MHLLFIDSVYYRSFLDNKLSSERVWDNNTFYFYLFLIVFVAFIGWQAESKRRRTGVLPNVKFSFIVVAVLLSFILGFRDTMVGMDTGGYKEYFNNAQNIDILKDTSIEPGFLFLMKLFHFILPSADWAIFLLSAITVCSVISTTWKYRNSINIFVAFSIYVAIYFFQAMNLTRMYFVVSLLLWGFHLMVEGNYKKYILLILLCSLIHYSSLFMLIPVFFLYFYKKNHLISLISIVVCIFLIIPLANNFEDYLMIARYAVYADSAGDLGEGIGLMLFFDYLPCLGLIFYALKKDVNGPWLDLLICYSAIGSFLRIMGYYVPGGGRLQVHFMPLFVLIAPYFINHAKMNSKRSYFIMMLGFGCFIIVKVHLYFMGYLASDGIMPYKFIWSN